MARKIAAGNWKMNGTTEALEQAWGLKAADGVTVLICPPATLIGAMANALNGTDIYTGGQDCHVAASGAHTGDISAAMLADAGASCVITGHSERRADHGEDDAAVAAKTRAAWEAGLTAIVCVGETLEDREAGRTLDVVGAQLDGSVPDGATPETTIVA